MTLRVTRVWARTGAGTDSRAQANPRINGCRDSSITQAFEFVTAEAGRPQSALRFLKHGRKAHGSVDTSST